MTDSTGQILIDLKTVCVWTSLSPATIRRYVKAGSFPPSIKLGPNRCAWCADDVKAWIADKIEGAG